MCRQAGPTHVSLTVIPMHLGLECQSSMPTSDTAVQDGSRILNMHICYNA